MLDIPQAEILITTSHPPSASACSMATSVWGNIATDAWVLSFIEWGYHIAVVPNLEPPGVLGLQPPEILASRGGGEGFREL